MGLRERREDEDEDDVAGVEVEVDVVRSLAGSECVECTDVFEIEVDLLVVEEMWENARRMGAVTFREGDMDDGKDDDEEVDNMEALDEFDNCLAGMIGLRNLRGDDMAMASTGTIVKEVLAIRVVMSSTSESIRAGLRQGEQVGQLLLKP